MPRRRQEEEAAAAAANPSATDETPMDTTTTGEYISVGPGANAELTSVDNAPRADRPVRRTATLPPRLQQLDYAAAEEGTAKDAARQLATPTDAPEEATNGRRSRTPRRDRKPARRDATPLDPLGSSAVTLDTNVEQDYNPSVLQYQCYTDKHAEFLRWARIVTLTTFVILIQEFVSPELRSAIAGDEQNDEAVHIANAVSTAFPPFIGLLTYLLTFKNTAVMQRTYNFLFSRTPEYSKAAIMQVNSPVCGLASRAKFAEATVAFMYGGIVFPSLMAGIAYTLPLRSEPKHWQEIMLSIGIPGIVTFLFAAGELSGLNEKIITRINPDIAYSALGNEERLTLFKKFIRHLLPPILATVAFMIPNLLIRQLLALEKIPPQYFQFETMAIGATIYGVATTATNSAVQYKRVSRALTSGQLDNVTASKEHMGRFAVLAQNGFCCSNKNNTDGTHPATERSALLR